MSRWLYRTQACRSRATILTNRIACDAGSDYLLGKMCHPVCSVSVTRFQIALGRKYGLYPDLFHDYKKYKGQYISENRSEPNFVWVLCSVSVTRFQIALGRKYGLYPDLFHDYKKYKGQYISENRSEPNFVWVRTYV